MICLRLIAYFKLTVVYLSVAFAAQVGAVQFPAASFTSHGVQSLGREPVATHGERILLKKHVAPTKIVIVEVPVAVFLYPKPRVRADRYWSEAVSASCTSHILDGTVPRGPPAIVLVSFHISDG
jgi:hypothetical protein